jgi:serine/threonine protein phosphatase 1
VTERLYAIGDIHGHADHLVDLLTRLLEDGMDPERDTIVFLGDYIDRGPASNEVVHIVRDCLTANPHWHALRGNHEQMMIGAMECGPEDWGTWSQWWYQGGRETVASFAGLPVFQVDPKDAAAIPPEVIGWMKDRPHAFAGYDFVHAGLQPGLSAFDATDPHDMLWIREEFLESDFDFGRIVVHGHTPAVAPVVRVNRIGIDTMLRGGYLTAVELSGAAPRFIRSV